MVLAWVGFATIGMFIARFMRPVWGEKEMYGKRVWFQVRCICILYINSIFNRVLQHENQKSHCGSRTLVKTDL